jgi:hypothetical protein
MDGGLEINFFCARTIWMAAKVRTAIVRFSCDEGYRLFGYEVCRCREDGLWSWGVDPECIKDVKYKITVAEVFFGIILPVLYYSFCS